jgi:hypothetical protein
MAKVSIRNIVLGGVLASLTAMSSVAQAAERVTVDQAPGVELPPQIAADVRAAIEDALAGRAQPGVPIEITLETGAVVIRVGSLWRRIEIARWDYSAMRTVALHVLDLLQPAPEAPEIATADSMPAPATGVVAEARASARTSERATEPAGPWSLHAGIAGARGAEGTDPWMVALAVGAAWSHDWMRIGLEVGWDHGFVRHPDGATTVKYDATPLRLVLAAQNSAVMAGVRAGVAEYRVTGQQPFWEVTPVVGPFLAFRLPVAGRVRGLLVGGFDYFARRTELSNGSPDSVYSTPQVAPYVAVVLEAVLGP